MYCLIVVPLYVYCWFFQMLILRCIVLGSSRSPECVMVCILPASVPSHDVTFHIQQTLVEAFCVEHAIPILKIGDLEKLAVIFAGRKDVANSLDNNQDEGEGDLTCLLVQVPEVKSPADQFVMEFCEMIFLPHPRIDLPA